MARRFTFDKLVRDKIPEMLRSKGCEFQERYVEKEEYLPMLKLKLLEEVSELQQATETNEIIEEVADILEVLHATVKALGISFEQAEEYRISKRKERGGFDKGIFIPYVEIEETKPVVSYFCSKPEQYQETT